ncbi:MAG TPA: hypothetical protein VFT98_11090 [Myxococcota bacterium]|nr:hypothetical protein [Myxococcota bacterium]
MLKRRIPTLLAVCASIVLASAASAQLAPGEGGTLFGGERLRVPGCGRLGGAVTLEMTLAPDGAWTIDSGANAYSGTSSGLAPRLIRLTLDTESLATLESKLESEATTLCEEPMTITALNANAALKLNKRRSHARLFLRARATGSTESGAEGSGLYRLRARGEWITNT